MADDEATKDNAAESTGTSRVPDAYILTDNWCKTKPTVEAISKIVRDLGCTWSAVSVTRTHWPLHKSRIVTPNPSPIVRYKASQYEDVEGGGTQECYDKGPELAEGVFALFLKEDIPNAVRELLAAK